MAVWTTRNRLGEAVSLLLDALTLVNNQSDLAKRMSQFIGEIHPAECVDLHSDAAPQEPEGASTGTAACGPYPADAALHLHEFENWWETITTATDDHRTMARTGWIAAARYMQSSLPKLQGSRRKE